jgi:signal transduction histidine kinase
VEVSLRPTNNQAVITVRDHGSGIPEEDLAFVFEPFYRVDKSRTPNTGGYGLGLSLAKTIVEAHCGSITISSNPDLGTTVRIVLLTSGFSPNR